MRAIIARANSPQNSITHSRDKQKSLNIEEKSRFFVLYLSLFCRQKNTKQNYFLIVKLILRKFAMKLHFQETV